MNDPFSNPKDRVHQAPTGQEPEPMDTALPTFQHRPAARSQPPEQPARPVTQPATARSPSQPGPSQPGPSQPGPARPGPSQPGPAQPTMSQSAPNRPAARQPAASQPASSQPPPPSRSVRFCLSFLFDAAKSRAGGKAKVEMINDRILTSIC